MLLVCTLSAGQLQPILTGGTTAADDSLPLLSSYLGRTCISAWPARAVSAANTSMSSSSSAGDDTVSASGSALTSAGRPDDVCPAFDTSTFSSAAFSGLPFLVVFVSCAAAPVGASPILSVAASGEPASMAHPDPPKSASGQPSNRVQANAIRRKCMLGSFEALYDQAATPVLPVLKRTDAISKTQSNVKDRDANTGSDPCKVLRKHPDQLTAPGGGRRLRWEEAEACSCHRGWRYTSRRSVGRHAHSDATWARHTALEQHQVPPVKVLLNKTGVHPR